MHYAEFAEDESQALLNAIKEYENQKWKVIGQKVGKPAKVSSVQISLPSPHRKGIYDVSLSTQAHANTSRLANNTQRNTLPIRFSPAPESGRTATAGEHQASTGIVRAVLLHPSGP